MGKRIRLLKTHGTLQPGTYMFSERIANYLISVGKAEEIIKAPPAKKVFVKQEKKRIETKEEKFTPETKDYSQVPVGKLDVGDMTAEELRSVIDNDERKTAVQKAKKELDERGL